MSLEPAEPTHVTPRDCVKGIHAAKLGTPCVCGDPGPPFIVPRKLTLQPLVRKKVE